ncbi:MAG: hypothetical protein IKQ15_04240 [Kiritimatiellae bacterium]|nr:hypothetical protein [Kiritimatiellia bacterium]
MRRVPGFVNTHHHFYQTLTRNIPAVQRAPGLTPRQIIDKFKTLKMVDVILPTTDGRTITLPRHIEPREDTALLLAQLDLTLPAQPPPKVSPSLSPRMNTVV